MLLDFRKLETMENNIGLRDHASDEPLEQGSSLRCLGKRWNAIHVKRNKLWRIIIK